MSGIRQGWHRPCIFFEKRDIWIGVFWTRSHPLGDDGSSLGEWLKIYVCVVPCFPVMFERRSDDLSVP